MRLGGRERRGPFREDGSQRHRVRRYAADLRSLPAHAGRSGPDQRGNARHLRGLEQHRTGQLPHRDHPRHPGLPGRAG